MKQQLLLFLFSINAFIIQASDTLNITSQIQKILFENQASITLQNEQFELENIHITIQEAILINADLKESKGMFVFRKAKSQKCGFIMQFNQPFGYVLQQENDEIFAIKTSIENILPNDTSHLSNHSHEDFLLPGIESVYQNNRKLPIGNNLTANALDLESKTDGSTCIYLDFDGENISGWGYNFPTVYPSNYNNDQIRKVWETIAADFLMFDVNVTTSFDVFQSYPITQRLECAFGEATGLNSVGGISLVSIFGTGKGCLVNSKNGDKGVETAHIGSHEIGHALGMLHDGTMWPGPSIPYYEGHADWAPIMGVGYGKTYLTWIKGDYQYASQQQDDIQIIANQLGLRTDDIVQATPFIVGKGDTLNWENNHGYIENSLDQDTFYFEVTQQGDLKLLLSTAVKHTNLDIEAVLYDASFNPILNKNTLLERFVYLDQNIAPGKYYLVIKSGFEKTVDDGFTNYSSYGYYEISGVIEHLKKEQFDMAISDISGFQQLCGEKVTGNIRLKNNGTNAISGGTLNIYVDGQLVENKSITSTIQPNDEITIANIEINQIGAHQLKFTYVIDPQYSETTLSNNTQLIDYHIENGELFNVKTNYPTYNGASPFWWDIFESNGNTLVASSKTVEVKNNQQSFCLIEDCYKFNFEGDFNLCSDYNTYVSGAIYNGGDMVTYNNGIYKAKWWNTNEPTKSSWEYIGPCNTTNYYVEFINQSQNDTIVQFYAFDYSGSQENEFCNINLTTNTAQIDNSTFYVYPNPATTSIHLKGLNMDDLLIIYDIKGSKISEFKVNNPDMEINVSNLGSGIYFIRNNASCVKLLIGS